MRMPLAPAHEWQSVGISKDGKRFKFEEATKTQIWFKDMKCVSLKIIDRADEMFTRFDGIATICERNAFHWIKEARKKYEERKKRIDETKRWQKQRIHVASPHPPTRVGTHTRPLLLCTHFVRYALCMCIEREDGIGIVAEWRMVISCDYAIASTVVTVRLTKCVHMPMLHFTLMTFDVVVSPLI